MKFWTFQRHEILEKIIETGIYYASFDNTSLIAGASIQAYNHILNDYNKLTNSCYRGLIFGIIGGAEFDTIQNMDELYKLIVDFGKRGGTFFEATTHWLFELEVPDSILITKCDFFRFTDVIFTFDENEPEELQKSTIGGLYGPNGKNDTWEFIQGHIPFIDRKWIVNTHTPRNIH